MKHKITITTVEALLINKALGFDMQNQVDNDMAELIKNRINDVVAKDLVKAIPTDLANKCGSCKWASERHHSYIDCNHPDKKPSFFARTRSACKKYELKEQNMKVDLSKKADLRELDYIEAMRKCMNENNKTWYTNTYEFSTGECFKIEIKRLDKKSML